MILATLFPHVKLVIGLVFDYLAKHDFSINSYDPSGLEAVILNW